MRRKDKERTEEFALAVADACEWFTLAMTDSAGQPYCVPLSMVRDGHALYFHCALDGEKLECLRAHPAVCVSCVCDTCLQPEHYTTAYKSAILRGTAQEITDEQEKIHALRLICARYAASNMAGVDAAITRSLGHTGIWKIALTGIAGKETKMASQTTTQAE